jgi:hypothetical protein
MKLVWKIITRPYKLVKVLYQLWKASNELDLKLGHLFYYIVELQCNRRFSQSIRSKIKEAIKRYPDPRLGGWMLGWPSQLVYVIVRVMKPELIVETGVGPGGSSALILLALEKNGMGKLISIDLPGADAQIYPQIGKNYNVHVPPGYMVGWLVPSWLKNRWELFLGDSKELLPKVLADSGFVDMFLHDSLHTEEHLWFELSTVFPYLRDGGLLLADDVNEYWSLAFVKFCQRQGLRYFVFSNRLGVAKK